MVACLFFAHTFQSHTKHLTKLADTTYYKKDSFYCYLYNDIIFIELFMHFDLDSEDPFLLLDYLDAYEALTPTIFINWFNYGRYKALSKEKEIELLNKSTCPLRYNVISLLLRQFCFTASVKHMHEQDITTTSVFSKTTSRKNKRTPVTSAGQKTQQASGSCYMS